MNWKPVETAPHEHINNEGGKMIHQSHIKKNTVADFMKFVLPPDGVPCSHPGCLNHVTHPCEGCGRVAGRKK